MNSLFPDLCPGTGSICLTNTVYTKDTSELKYLKQNNAKIFGYTLKDDFKQLRILISQNVSFQSDIVPKAHLGNEQEFDLPAFAVLFICIALILFCLWVVKRVVFFCGSQVFYGNFNLGRNVCRAHVL